MGQKLVSGKVISLSLSKLLQLTATYCLEKLIKIESKIKSCYPGIKLIEKERELKVAIERTDKGMV
jgi:hypothetical protein